MVEVAAVVTIIQLSEDIDAPLTVHDKMIQKQKTTKQQLNATMQQLFYDGTYPGSIEFQIDLQ